MTFVVSPERVEAFRASVGGPAGVPPTLLTAAEFSLYPQIVGDPALGIDLRRVVHASQEYEYARPLRVGETLQVEARIASVRHKGGTGFLTIETHARGDDGDVVAVARSTMIERGSPA